MENSLSEVPEISQDQIGNLTLSPEHKLMDMGIALYWTHRGGDPYGIRLDYKGYVKATLSHGLDISYHIAFTFRQR